jgi:hypothetical protein
MYRGYRDKMLRESEKDKRAKKNATGPRPESRVTPLTRPEEKGPPSPRRDDA